MNCITQYVPVMTLDAILVRSFKKSWIYAGWVFDRDNQSVLALSKICNLYTRVTFMPKLHVCD